MATKSKKWMGFLILGTFMFCLFIGFVHAQPVYENTGHNWTYTYSESGPSGVQVNEIRASWWDYNIYAVGRVPRTGSYNDFTVISLTYDTGDTNWIYRYNGPANRDNNANTFVIDNGYSPGYIYAAGYSVASNNKKDLMVIKLNPATGDTMWTYRYNGSAGYSDEALAIDIGNDRHIYVAGYTEISGLKKDFLVLKLDTLGTQIREYQLNGPAHDHDQANAIKAPKSGGNLEIFAAGYVGTSNSKDFAVVKLDTSLSEQWHYYFDGDAHEDDECLAFNKDQSTDVIAVGYSTGIGTGKDFTVSEYTSTGLAWTYTKDGDAHVDDEAKAVCIGPYGIYLATAGYLTDTLANGKDYAVIGLGGVGDEEFVYTYNGPGNSDDEALAIDFIDYSGDFNDAYFSAGYCKPATGARKLVVMKHRAMMLDMGFPYWIYKSTIGGGYAQANSIHMPWNGNVYVGGGGPYTKFNAIGLPENFPPTIPELVSPVDSAFLSDTADVTLTWNQSENPDNLTGPFRYIIEIDTDPGFSSPDTVIRIGISDTTYTDIFVDTLHYWRVRAKVGFGQQHLGDWSEVWSFAFDLTPPNTPVLISPIADACVPDTSVTFDWTVVTFGREVPTKIHYVVQVDTIDGFLSPIVQDTLDTNTANWVFPGEDYYYWRVKAYDLADNESGYAGTETFMTDLNPPVIDSETVWEETAFCGPFNCYAKITDIWGFDEVLLCYKLMEDPAWFSDTMTEGAGDWYQGQIPPGIVDNDTIRYYYYAKDNAEYETRVPETGYYWFIGNSTGVVEENPEIPDVFSFNIRSNLIKAKATFNLSLPRSSSVTLEIYDASGRLVATPANGMRSAGNHTITWTPQINGVYFYALKSPWKNKTGKILFVR